MVWTLVCLYALTAILLHIPAIQHWAGSEVANALGTKLGTVVKIDRVDLGFPGRVVIDGVTLLDQKNKPLLRATRLSVSAEIMPLLEGRISISSAQLFGVKAQLYKENAQAKPNFQFIVDSLASKDTTSQKTPLDLHIHSLIMRGGSVSYDQYDVAPTQGRFNAAHLSVSDISAHLILNCLTPDSLNLNCKRLSLAEQAGLHLKALSFHLVAGKRGATLTDFHLELPHTQLVIPQLAASYEWQQGSVFVPSINYNGEIAQTTITPLDITCFLPLFKNFTSALHLSTSFSGTSSSLRVKKLDIHSDDKSLNLLLGGSATKTAEGIRWAVQIGRLTASARTVEFVSENLKGQKVSVPEVVSRLGNVTFSGEAGGAGNALSTRGILQTDAGTARLLLGLHDRKFSAHVETAGIALGKLLNSPKLGTIAANISAKGTLHQGRTPDVKAHGTVNSIDWNGYTYRNINIDGLYAGGTLKGQLGMDDPNGEINVKGLLSSGKGKPRMNLAATIAHLNPSALGLTHKYPSTTFGGHFNANLQGSNLSDLSGTATLEDFTMHGPTTDYALQSLTLNAGYKGHEHYVKMESDFGNATLYGQYDYNTIATSITNLVASKLPTLPGLPHAKHTPGNTFDLDLTLQRTDWLKALFGVDLELGSPVRLSASMDDRAHQLDLTASLPNVTWNGTTYENTLLTVTTPGDTLHAQARLTRTGAGGARTLLGASLRAANNHLTSALTFDDLKPHGMNGKMNLDARFFKNGNGQSVADVHVLPSVVMVGDTAWQVHPSRICYQAGALHVEDFAIEHNKQYLRIEGNATRHAEDSITVNLKDVNVEYILNLVNFHSVDFSGLASGQASVKGIMGSPQAHARLSVRDFEFEQGRMGTLHANVDWELQEGQINIHALADDGPGRQTFIHGYVSPKRSDIDLGIEARGTRLEFMQTLCSSFLSNVDAQGTGHVRIFGPLKTINMEGQIVAKGQLDVTSLGTTYTLTGDTVDFQPDHIRFRNCPITDGDKGKGVVNGEVTHHNLSNFGYDLRIDADKLLAYDFKTYGDQTFFGTVWATGLCTIEGKSGEVNINVDVTPEKGSFLEYNAVSPDAVGGQQFIQWNDRTPHADSLNTAKPAGDLADDLASDMHINFLVNATPDVTLRVLMDPQSHDMIRLNGSGVIRASYYNKGAFQMFGNYLVDHGTYNLTIQQVLRKDFQFLPGGSITFGGNPYDALLNLKAQYAVQGVSLSDLNVGRSFTQNTIRVNCLMNIGGTPGQPRVDFGMQLPTLSADAEQMVRSLMNTEEEMNQQVLYLLAVGRFYNSGAANGTQQGAEQRSQTTLAMQSLLSGTISQQINNVIGTLVGKGNWNFGANISTGDEGWNNAEYEGTLSGRMLSGRMLFNGQFGYRDNANATTSFIGDFNLKYLLTPNGGVALNIYNQTNDRYFTRNSLNTQGIGLQLKKDFTSLSDLFGIKKKAKRKKNR